MLHKRDSIRREKFCAKAGILPLAAAILSRRNIASDGAVHP